LFIKKGIEKIKKGIEKIKKISPKVVSYFKLCENDSYMKIR
jgi:hypothetical protein